jgi:predicted permease
MHIRLVAGRDFNESDRDGTRVVIVNQGLANRHWTGQNAVGRTIRFDGELHTIVGVVGDVKQREWTASPMDELYFPFAQRASGFGLSSMTLVARTAVEPRSVALAIQAAVSTAEKNLPISNITTMEEVIWSKLARARAAATLIGLFALVAAALAAIGIYGVVSYSVSRRIPEIGVRMALGADRRAVQRMVVVQGFQPVLMGTGAGLIAASAASRFMSDLLYGVKPSDPLTLAAVAATILFIAFVAALIPAVRASCVDPVIALRE